MGRAGGQWLVWLVITALQRCVDGQQVEVMLVETVINTGTGWNSTLAVSTLLARAHSVEWTDPGGNNILTQIQGRLFIKNGTLYVGRVALLSNGSLSISRTVHTDQGVYTVKVEPLATTGLTSTSVTLTLLVYDPVVGVRVSGSGEGVIEGREDISLSCSVASGSGLTYTWLMDGETLDNSTRVTVTPTDVRVSPSVRTDAGNYTCVVRNPITAGRATRGVLVYFGPESLTTGRLTSSDCVQPDQAVLGRPLTLTCGALSSPPATYAWSLRGRILVRGTTLTIEALETGGSGTYTCAVANGRTGLDSNVTITVTAVGGCLSAGAVAGIVIGAVVALILLILLILLIIKCRRHRANPKKQPVVPRTSAVNEKVQPWINRHQQRTPGFQSAPPPDSAPRTPHTVYPASTGSMVPSTFNGGSGSISVTGQSVHISTLV